MSDEPANLDEQRGGGVIEGQEGFRVLDTGREKFSTEREARGEKPSWNARGEVGAFGEVGGLRVKRDCASGARMDTLSSVGGSL